MTGNGKTAWIMTIIALVGLLAGAVYAFATVNNQATHNKDSIAELKPAVQTLRGDVADIKADVREALTILRERKEEKAR